jgi:Pretoxin HINT domain
VRRGHWHQSEPLSEARKSTGLRVGDKVEAYDPKTGETGPHTVTAVMVNLDPVLEHLSLDSGSIETTPNHPFFTADRGWVLAGDLLVGEQIRTESGQNATVVAFTLDATPSTMWDLTVDGAHSFFVGSGAVLVHNCPSGGGGGPKPPKTFIEPTNPAQLPPTDLPPGYSVRLGPPTAKYPNGYWRLYDAGGHAVDPSTLQQVGSVTGPEFESMTHVPLPPTGK